ncbi:MAG: ABC transporter substrate-binding protein [Bacteroidales bacterium]|nr:ABC transporter substrate-binding protein [Candidatus Egerieousia equi]
MTHIDSHCITRYLICLAVLYFLCACGNGAGNASDSEACNPHSVSDESEYFSIDAQSNILTIKEAWNNGQSESYDISSINAERIVCMSSSHAAFLCELGCQNNIVGIAGTRFIYNPQLQKRIQMGLIQEVGSESLPDYEMIISLKPTLVTAYGISGSDNSYIETLRRYGLTVLVLDDYLEASPLGRMAYIKLFGAITGHRAEADSIYNAGVGKYNAIRDSIAEAIGGSEKVKVLMNAPFKGIWYIPGGRNYTARMINDAGGQILGSNPDAVSSTTESLEKMLVLASDAQVWFNPNTATTIFEVIEQNPLLSDIPAVRNLQVYNNNLRQRENGGSDIWESGYVHPELILKDLAMILHPEIFHSDSLYYHRRLK